MYQYTKESKEKSRLRLYAVIATSKKDGFVQAVCHFNRGEKWSANRVYLYTYPPTKIIERFGKDRITHNKKENEEWEISIVRVNSKKCPINVDWTAKPDGAYNHPFTMKQTINSTNAI